MSKVEPTPQALAQHFKEQIRKADVLIAELTRSLATIRKRKKWMEEVEPEIVEQLRLSTAAANNLREAAQGMNDLIAQAKVNTAEQHRRASEN